jgi:hypothetical protein
MNETILFSIDVKTDEVLVSSSEKGSNKITFIERISRDENIVLYNSVVTLTSIVNETNLDTKLFTSMDKVCQLAYKKYKESKS